MGTDEGQRKQDTKKGFAGLSSMVSDMDAKMNDSKKQAPPIHPSSWTWTIPADTQTQPKATPRPIFPPSTPNRGVLIGKWLLAITIGVGIFQFAILASNSRTSGSTKAPGAASGSVVKTPSRPSESIPAVGRNNVLSMPEIRYCLAEKIRLDAAESVIDRYVHSDVDKFNQFINNYNTRCAEFRYRSGALESARRDVEPFRSQLQADGRKMFPARVAPSARSETQLRAPQGYIAAPDLMVQAIQRRLNELGYKVGRADGFVGAKTRAAIRDFQRDNGLPEDGNANASLLERARRANSPSRSRSSESVAE